MAPDVERYYQGADIHLCCSSYESFSLALLEAAASGLPLVTTRVGVASSLVGSSGFPGGILVRSEMNEIGASLASLANDSALRARYGMAAQQRAREFSWNRVADSFDSQYQQLLQPLPTTDENDYHPEIAE